ncbi:MAG: sugar transferase [Bilophila wadsworthia]
MSAPSANIWCTGSRLTDQLRMVAHGRSFSLNTRGSLRRLKRAFDLFATLGLLICTSPIMLHRHCHPCGISRPRHLPAASRGLFGQDFTVYKFRSMRTDAEKTVLSGP